MAFSLFLRSCLGMISRYVCEFEPNNQKEGERQ